MTFWAKLGKVLLLLISWIFIGFQMYRSGFSPEATRHVMLLWTLGLIFIFQKD